MPNGEHAQDDSHADEREPGLNESLGASASAPEAHAGEASEQPVRAPLSGAATATEPTAVATDAKPSASASEPEAPAGDEAEPVFAGAVDVQATEIAIEEAFIEEEVDLASADGPGHDLGEEETTAAASALPAGSGGDEPPAAAAAPNGTSAPPNVAVTEPTTWTGLEDRARAAAPEEAGRDQISEDDGDETSWPGIRTGAVPEAATFLAAVPATSELLLADHTTEWTLPRDEAAPAAEVQDRYGGAPGRGAALVDDHEESTVITTSPPPQEAAPVAAQVVWPSSGAVAAASEIGNDDETRVTTPHLPSAASQSQELMEPVTVPVDLPAVLPWAARPSATQATVAPEPPPSPGLHHWGRLQPPGKRTPTLELVRRLATKRHELSAAQIGLLAVGAGLLGGFVTRGLASPAMPTPAAVIAAPEPAPSPIVVVSEPPPPVVKEAEPAAPAAKRRGRTPLRAPAPKSPLETP